MLQKAAWRKKEYFVRAEKYVKQYRTEKRQLIEAKRSAKVEGNFFVEAQPKVAVVTRIRGYLPPISLILSYSVLTLVQYPWCQPQAQEDPSVVAPSPDQQHRVRSFEQGHLGHAQAR